LEGRVKEYILIADIGKKRDYFALMLFHDNARIEGGNKVLETPDRIIHRYDITNIEQYQGFDYDEMAARIAVIMENPRLKNNAELVVDGTGVGDAVISVLRKRGLYPIPIIFTGGKTATDNYTKMGEVFTGASGKLAGARVLESISVPKKDLVDAGIVLVQQGRIAVAPGKWKDRFLQQLAGFKEKFNERTGKKKYEAEDEALHDDLVVCYLMGAWWILNRKDRNAIEERRLEQSRETGWEPADYM
jgi:hypothetical protein